MLLTLHRGFVDRSVATVTLVAPPDGMSFSFAELAKLRGVPIVFLVDANLALSATCGAGTADASPEAMEHRWTTEIAPFVRGLIASGGSRDDGFFAGAMSAELLVRVFALHGAFDGYAVFVERQRTRKSVRNLSLRFGLSLRECEVLELIIAGNRNTDVAEALHICDATVQSHVRNIGIKMGCTKRSAMIAKALT